MSTPSDGWDPNQQQGQQGSPNPPAEPSADPSGQQYGQQPQQPGQWGQPADPAAQQYGQQYGQRCDLVKHRWNKVEKVFELGEKWNFFSHNVREQFKVGKNQK